MNDIVVGEDLLLPFHGYSYYGAQDFTTEAAETAGELARLEEVVEANGGELFYLCIPEQSSYFRDEYPENMDNHAETLDAMSAAFTGAMASAGLRLIDAGEVYAAEGSPRDYYLNTDHHYSCRGMLSAYTALMDAVNSATGLGLRVYSEADLTLETLENPVLGSLDRKLFGLYGTQERLVLPHLNESIPFTRTDNGESVAAELFDIPADGELAPTASTWAATWGRRSSTRTAPSSRASCSGATATRTPWRPCSGPALTRRATSTTATLTARALGVHRAL